VPLPAGNHRVTIVFRPVLWRVGLGISVATMLILLALAGAALARRGRRGRRVKDVET
jgi:hypothetical protein